MIASSSCGPGASCRRGRWRNFIAIPADLFVARLFSEINEIPWTVTGGALRTPVGTFVVPEIGEGETAVLCIRQRAIRFAQAGEGQPARIRHVRLLGDAAVLEVAVQGFEQLLKVRLRESRGADRPMASCRSRLIPSGSWCFPPIKGENRLQSEA